MSDATENIVRVRRYRTADAESLIAAAASDKHKVFLPTHIIEKGGEITGFFSIGAVPTVIVWMHSEKMKVRDSLTALSVIESVPGCVNAPGLILPCRSESPVFPYLEKAGYVNM